MDSDLGPPSTATVQKKNRKMTSAKEHSFRRTLSSLQRRERDTSECAYNMAVLATDSAILTPQTHRGTMLSRDHTSQLLEYYHSCLCHTLCQIRLCIFVSYLAPLFPALGKGREESLCGETESKQMESAWGPEPRSISCCPTETAAAEARTALERAGSS